MASRSLFIALSMFVAPISTSAATLEYTFTDLGMGPPNFIWATGTGLNINSKGHIAGASDDPAGPVAQIGIPGNGVIETNATLGGATSTAFAINESDHLAGHSETATGEFHAFLWDGIDMIDLGTLGGMNSAGFAINESSQVTGGAETEAGTENAFFWDGSQMHDLGNLGGDHAHGRGISSNGFVTGIGTLPDDPGEFHAFLWDGTTMHDLGTLGGASSSGEAVNVHGVVAGTSSLADGRDVATVWDGADMINLGVLEGDQRSVGISINSNGLVTGWSTHDLTARHRAFVWDGEDMTELPSPYHSQAWFINEEGAIFGLSFVGTEIHFVRWDPVETRIVMIDIQPHQTKNKVNVRSRGNIWVAVLSDIDTTSPFDPLSELDISTVEFGPDGAKALRHKVKDVNQDGLEDLLLQFNVRDSGLAYGSVEATLTGETYSGQSIAGTASVQTAGCK